MNGDTSTPTPVTAAPPPPQKPRRRVSRTACLVLIALAAPLLLYLEVGKPTLSADPVLAPIISMTLTRLIGAVVFFALLLSEGYRVLNPLAKPFGRSFFFILPPLAVVVNNFPILALLWGEATVVYDAPVYWVWFALECLAIGLFEEAAFRGVILLIFAERRYRTRGGLFLSIILTSAVFGLVHLFNLFVGADPVGVLMQIGYSFLIGAMCAVVLFKTRNLWVCIILHALFDFGGKLIDTLGEGAIWNPPTVIFTAVLAVVVTAYMVWQFWRIRPEEIEPIYGTHPSEISHPDVPAA